MKASKTKVEPKVEPEPQPEVESEATVEETPVEEVPPEETSEREQPSKQEALPKATPSAVRTRTPQDKIKFLNILDHGDSGTGKTRFGGTMVQAGLKTFYIVFNEDELLTLDQQKITGYDYYIVKDYSKLFSLYLMLRKNTKKYEGVVLDGLGDFQQEAKDYELSDMQPSLQFLDESIRGQRRMSISNWGNLLEMTRHFIDPLLKLPIHKIITCVSEADDDPKTGKAKVYPALQGALQQVIAAHFSVVGYSYIAHWGPNTYYCMTTQPHEALATKDRTGLNRVLVNPKFSHFLNALNGKIPPQSELQQKLGKTLVVRPQVVSVRVEPKKSTT